MKKSVILIFLLFVIVCKVNATSYSVIQAAPSDRLLTQRWNASWITCPNVSIYDYGVYHFRKTFNISKRPESFVINISADNHYRLYVNGTPVCNGPSRGDIQHWYYETVDIASFLDTGENVLAVVVWNFGEYTPGAQMTLNTGLIVQGNNPMEEIVNTDNSWKVIQNRAYSPSIVYRQDVGCAESIDGKLYPWGWEQCAYNDSDWQKARLLDKGQPYGTGTSYSHVLAQREIPLMEESQLRINTVRRTENITVSDNFLKGTEALVVPANRKVTILLDQDYLTNAYPELKISGGKGAEVKLTYSEALFQDGAKGNRNEIENKTIIGFIDKFYPDGGKDHLFRTLWFRTYRYIQLEITTQDQELIINDLYGMFTAYPFKENGYFKSDDISIEKIWNVGWRTARLCAHETYFDCPYYEQLQYVGDTRIQALISLYVDGDDRLMKQAIKMFDYSRSHEGITTSRYPSRVPQYIPPFSLYWINMVHDYWMYRDDETFVKECMPGLKTVLEWFSEKVDSESGMLGALPHWNFVDWPVQWPWSNDSPTGGVPPGGVSGHSAVLSLQLAYTLKDAIDLLREFGEDDLVGKYQSLYELICKNTYQKCWDSDKQLLSDDPVHTSYSQHVNIMGILSDAIPQEKQKDLFEKIDSDPNLIQATFYYRFYLFRALEKVGLAERYTQMLKPWYEMLDMGLTTFAENPEPTRSDCHAWSSSPLYDLLSIVCGIKPSSSGFKTVKIKPHLGHLKEIKGRVPHPAGYIDVDLRKQDMGLEGSITLPENVLGIYLFNNEKIELHPGVNIIGE